MTFDEHLLCRIHQGIDGFQITSIEHERNVGWPIVSLPGQPESIETIRPKYLPPTPECSQFIQSLLLLLLFIDLCHEYEQGLDCYSLKILAVSAPSAQNQPHHPNRTGKKSPVCVPHEKPVSPSLHHKVIEAMSMH